MNRIFEPRGFFTVPDGTDVSPFLNATDVNQQDVPWSALGEMSITAGRIGPGVRSWIHIFPAVTQVTYVLSGNLTVWMKDVGADEPYSRDLKPGQAVITKAGTLFQLDNQSDAVAEVLYIVSPSYVFDAEDGDVIFDDSIMIARSWSDVEVIKFDGSALEMVTTELVEKRGEALRHLALRKGRRED